MNWCNSHYMAELAWIWGCNSTGLPLAWGMGEGAGNKLPTGWLCWGRSWNSFLASFLVGASVLQKPQGSPRAGARLCPGAQLSTFSSPRWQSLFAGSHLCPKPTVRQQSFSFSSKQSFSYYFPRCVFVFREYLGHITEQNSESALSYSL